MLPIPAVMHAASAWSRNSTGVGPWSRADEHGRVIRVEAELARVLVLAARRRGTPRCGSGCGCPACQRLVARNWNSASSGCAFTAPMVAKSVGVSTPFIGLGVRVGLLASWSWSSSSRWSPSSFSVARGPVIGLVRWASDGIAGDVPGRPGPRSRCDGGRFPRRRGPRGSRRELDRDEISSRRSTAFRRKRAARLAMFEAREASRPGRRGAGHGALAPSPSGGSTRSAALRVVVEGTASETGQRFFRALVRNLAAGARHPRRLGDRVRRAAGPAARARVLVRRRAGLTDFEYAIDGTPCATAVASGACFHLPDRVFELYPDDRENFLRAGVVSYLGVPLLDADERVLGHLAVLDVRPMPADPAHPRGVPDLRRPRGCRVAPRCAPRRSCASARRSSPA